MYHRYMPSGNGQFKRQTVPDPPRPSAQKQPGQTGERPAPPPTFSPSPPSSEPQAKHTSDAPAASAPAVKSAAGNAPPPQFHLPFLDKLLPNHDSGDLLLLAIMLLLISEGTEDSASVVMTLAIFLFMQ